MSDNEEINENLPPLQVEAETRIATSGMVVNPPMVEVAPPPAAAVTSNDRVSLNVYLSLKNVPVEYRKGMSLHTAQKVATVAEWETIFATY